MAPVELAGYATRKFTWNRGPAYVGAQLVGATLGAVGIWIAYGGAARSVANVAATFPAAGVEGLRAFVVEVVVTFVLVFVGVSVATEDRVPAAVARRRSASPSPRASSSPAPSPRGSVNAARTLGPMIVAGQFTAALVCVLGPIICAVPAALLCDRFFSEAGAPG